MNKRKGLILAALFLMAAPSLNGCSSASNAINLRVYNCEDYICEDLLTAFEEHMKEESLLSGYKKMFV